METGGRTAAIAAVQARSQRATRTRDAVCDEGVHCGRCGGR
jgi:hypothetical protein